MTHIELERLGQAVAAAGQSGEALFRELAHLLWDATGSRFAIICQVIPGDDHRLRSLALVDNGVQMAPFDFEIGPSPWREVLEHGRCVVHEHVAERFPNAIGLEQFGLEAYVGERIVDAAGRTRGLVSISYERPLASTRMLEQYLEIFASRVGAEFDRLDAQRRLREENETLQLLTEIGRDLARVSAEEADDVLPALLGRVARSFGIGRIVTYRFDDIRQVIDRVAVWRAAGEDPAVDPAWQLQAHRLASAAAAAGETPFMVRRATAPEGVRQLLTAHDMQWYVNFPVAGPRDEITGGMALYVEDSAPPWSESQTRALLSFASAFASTAFRVLADREKARSTEQLHRAAMELAVGEERLRASIASELHDNVLQDLASLKLMLDQMGLDDARAEGTDSALVASATAQKIIDDTRTLLGSISPPVLKTLGFAKAIEWLTERAAREGGFACEARLDPALAQRQLPGDLALVLFQIVRELLNNVTKHAGADEVQVVVDVQNDIARLEVTDNGCGLDPARLSEVAGTQRFGLANVRNRVEYLDGRFSLAVDGGTRVVVEVPVRR